MKWIAPIFWRRAMFAKSAALRSGRPFPIVPSIMRCGSAAEAGHLREVEALAKPSAATAAQQTAGLPDNS
jgi:hypothetical protein